MAAVNDIAAREGQLEAAREEQFQSYLNSNSNSIPDHNIAYYTNPRVDNNPSIHKNPNGKSAEIPDGPAKAIKNELTDEYVDINEMEFIEQSNKTSLQDENILTRRTPRKKTTKQRIDDECNFEHFY